MTEQTTPRTSSFSARTSWVGVLLLGAGLSQMALPSSQATSPGPQSASLEFSHIDDSFGVLSGGRQTDFNTGTTGWQGPAFESLGMMGIEWTTSLQEHLRRDISPDPATASPSPGAESTWTTAGYLSADPTNQLYTDKIISLSGNQVRFSLRLRSLADEPESNRRLYWIAELAAGYDPVYSGAGTSSVVITDASGLHPTIIMQVTTVAGTATFEGGNSLHTPLVDGDRSPTMYVLPGDSTDFTMEITVGILDADPCSASAAASFAATQGGVFGQVWESLTACAADATWSITADGEESANLVLDLNSPYLAPSPPTTRTLDIQGLPEGVTWARAEDSGPSLQVNLTASTTVTPGTYPLTWSSSDSVDSGGVTSLSRPSVGGVTLTILAPPVPEPAPLVSAPTASAPSAGIPESSPAPTVIAEPEKPAAVPTPVAPTLEVPVLIPPLVEVSDDPPSSLSLDRVPRSVGEVEPLIPEPLGAGAWLGLGTGLLASGGIITALRRRFRRAGVARGATTEGID